MAAAYSMDLRERVIQDCGGGLSSKELAERYHVSRAWVDALKQRRRETGRSSHASKPNFAGGCWRARKIGWPRSLRPSRMRRSRSCARRCRRPPGLATIWRALDQLDLTVKKNVHADEQRRPDVAAERRRWRDAAAARRQAVCLSR